MKRLEVSGLRKGGPLLDEAAKAWTNAEPVALPSECGYFQLDPEGETWLSHQPPTLTDPTLNALARVFWPGPLRIRLPHPQGKRPWQVPAHPLAQAFLALIGPVRARWLGDPPDQGIVLVWKDPTLNLPFSEVDCACTPWRWLRSGAVDRREVEWVAGCTTVLSGLALPQLPLLVTPSQERQLWRVDP